MEERALSLEGDAGAEPSPPLPAKGAGDLESWFERGWVVRLEGGSDEGASLHEEATLEGEAEREERIGSVDLVDLVGWLGFWEEEVKLEMEEDLETEPCC